MTDVQSDLVWSVTLLLAAFSPIIVFGIVSLFRGVQWREQSEGSAHREEDRDKLRLTILSMYVYDRRDTKTSFASLEVLCQRPATHELYLLCFHDRRVIADFLRQKRIGSQITTLISEPQQKLYFFPAQVTRAFYLVDFERHASPDYYHVNPLVFYLVSSGKMYQVTLSNADIKRYST